MAFSEPLSPPELTDFLRSEEIRVLVFPLRPHARTNLLAELLETQATLVLPTIPTQVIEHILRLLLAQNIMLRHRPHKVLLAHVPVLILIELLKHTLVAERTPEYLLVNFLQTFFEINVFGVGKSREFVAGSQPVFQPNRGGILVDIVSLEDAGVVEDSFAESVAVEFLVDVVLVEAHEPLELSPFDVALLVLQKVDDFIFEFVEFHGFGGGLVENQEFGFLL